MTFEKSQHPDHAPCADSQAGLTLIELLIYVMLLLGILTIIGSMLLNGLNAERIVRSSSQVTTAGQLTAESIQRGVRNSNGFVISSPDGLDQMVTVRKAGGRSVLSYTCQAWYYSASEHTIRSTSGPDGTPIASDAPLTWSLMAEGVAPKPSGAVFTVVGPELIIDFNFTAPDREPISILSSARARSTSTESSSCV